jgi:putative heme transporter
VKFRTWLSIATVLVLGAVVYFAWPEILKAFASLSRVNPWILALLVPIQVVSFWATGETLLSYLRARGSLKGLHPLAAVRMSLEFNFVNNILPSGGAAGISYIGWKLSHFGVHPGRSTMGQLVRFAVTFASFLILLLASVIALVIGQHATPGVIYLSLLVGFIAVTLTTLAIVLISSQKRLTAFSHWLTYVVNGVVRFFTRGKREQALNKSLLDGFFAELHTDYIELRADRRVLIKPFLWSFVLNIFDVALFWVTFQAFGVWVDPATLFIAFGLSSIISLVVVTPNGAGAYEAVMVGFIVYGGTASDVAIAGVLLARVILLLGTIVFGYVFYQLTIIKYGKAPISKSSGAKPVALQLAEAADGDPDGAGLSGTGLSGPELGGTGLSGPGAGGPGVSGPDATLPAEDGKESGAAN